MTCGQTVAMWLLVVYATGVPVTWVFNVYILLGSGGIILSPWAIFRNGLLWPLMLPFLIVVWWGEGRQ